MEHIPIDRSRNSNRSKQDFFWAVSDLHLHPSRPGVIQHFRQFLDHAADSTNRLFILGDLFDYWIGPYSFHSGEFSAVFHALKKATEEGLNISFVAGNRDFLARRDLERQLSITTYRDCCALRSESSSWIGIHGDTLCHQDTSYQFYRRLIQNRYIGDVIQRFPDGIKSKIIQDLRQVSKRKIERMDSPGKKMSRYRIRSLMRSGEGFEHLIAGHAHKPGHHRITVNGSQRSVWILGDWFEPVDCTYFIGRPDQSTLATF